LTRRAWPKVVTASPSPGPLLRFALLAVGEDPVEDGRLDRELGRARERRRHLALAAQRQLRPQCVRLRPAAHAPAFQVVLGVAVLAAERRRVRADPEAGLQTALDHTPAALLRVNPPAKWASPSSR